MNNGFRRWIRLNRAPKQTIKKPDRPAQIAREKNRLVKKFRGLRGAKMFHRSNGRLCGPNRRAEQLARMRIALRHRLGEAAIAMKTAPPEPFPLQSAQGNAMPDHSARLIKKPPARGNNA